MKLGWCMTGHHQKCPATMPTLADRPSIVCSCSCHPEDES